MSTRPSLIDSLPRADGENPGDHVRECTESGYPLMGSSPAERAEAQVRLARCKAQAMRDHPFVGDGPYCEDWGRARRSGNPATGVIVMNVQCGYPRDTHPDNLVSRSPRYCGNPATTGVMAQTLDRSR